MQIIILDYPTTFSFNIEEELPEFGYGCETRTSILHRQIIQHQIETTCHNPSDYLVEVIYTFSGGEIWEIGS